MEARQTIIALVLATTLSSATPAQGPYVATRSAPTRAIGPQTLSQVRSDNFIVSAATPAQAEEVVQTAEAFRKDLAIHWLGHEIPKWPQPCPILVQSSRDAGGETKFTFANGSVGMWQMRVQGTRERILDSVLPHEITHTVLATHFAPLGRPVPRWADEGACTTVEHSDERGKHDHMLVQFLSSGRGIPFETMFNLEDYPRDIMPLYAQGYSVASFLIAQGGPRHFVEYLEEGMRTNDWVRATQQFYAYPKIGSLKVAWNKWVADGGGEVVAHTSEALGLSTGAIVRSGGSTSDSGKGAVRLATAIGPSRSAAPSDLAASSTSDWRTNDRTQPSDPPSMGSTRANSTAPLDDQGWYRRQLNQNPSSTPAVVSASSDDRLNPSNLVVGESIPIPARSNVTNASAAAAIPNQPPQYNLSQFDEQHRVSLPQPLQTIGGPVRNFAPGPNIPLYR